MSELMLKTYEADVKAIEGERALNVTINTNRMDRDGDIVEPKGAKLANYRKNPVVLMAHKYEGLAIAKAEDLRKTDSGISAKVVFPPEGDYPLADTVYKLYKGKFMRAWSIGFIPIKSEDIPDDEIEDGKLAEQGIVRRGKRIKSWELLEFSACAVPSNPDALSNMMKKGIDIQPLKEEGFIEIEDEKEKDLLDNNDNEKIEETEEYIRIPVKGEEGKHKGHKIRWITVSAKEGIRGIYCIDCKKIITFVFDKKKGWTLEKAKRWMREHGKDIENIEAKELEEILFKSIGGAKDLPINDRTEWDANAAVARMRKLAGGPDKDNINWDKYRRGFVWYDSKDKENFGAYKLPFADVVNGKLTAIWGGVFRSMAALMGARGGVDIGGDKRAAYNFLVSYYKRFDKEPPELRNYEEDELKELFPENENVRKSYNAEEIYEIVKENKELKEKIKELELKAGAVLNAKNKQNLKQAQQLIQAVLDSAESTREDSQENDKDNEKEIEIVEERDNIRNTDVKSEVTDEGDIEVDDKVILEIINEKMNYLLGRVKQSNTKKQ